MPVAAHPKVPGTGLRRAGTAITLATQRAAFRYFRPGTSLRGNIMAWTTPTLVEICVGLEINGYLPAEF
jgi:coenzyme PQQ precursor peptide PqqA